MGKQGDHRHCEFVSILMLFEKQNIWENLPCEGIDHTTAGGHDGCRGKQDTDEGEAWWLSVHHLIDNQALKPTSKGKWRQRCSVWRSSGLRAAELPPTQ
jgi:hypothetical protein